MVSWKRIGIVLAAVLASLALTGAGQVSPVTSGPENQAAAHAVAVATGRADGTGADLVPPDFAEVMGYTPELVLDGVGVRVIDPAGNCSSPAGSAGYDFDRACRFHDYGYDLLRYAADRGGELGPWARMAIDDQFGVDLRAHCADPVVRPDAVRRHGPANTRCGSTPGGKGTAFLASRIRCRTWQLECCFSRSVSGRGWPDGCIGHASRWRLGPVAGRRGPRNEPGRMETARP